VISDKADNRNIISLEDLQEDGEKQEEKKEEREEKSEVREKKSPYLSDEEIKEYLERYRGRIPSVILRDIYEMLKGRRITERHIDRIVEKVEAMLNADNQLRKIDDIYRKLESLEKLLRQDTRISGEVVKETGKAEEKKVEEKTGEESAEVEVAGGAGEVETGEVEIASGAEGVGGTAEGVEKPETAVTSDVGAGRDEIGPERQVEIGKPGGEVMRDMRDAMRDVTYHAHAHPETRVEGYREPYREQYPRYPARRDRDYGDSYYGSYGLFDTEPRLSRIPTDAKGIMLLLKWIEFLMERVGYDGLEDVLNYYVDINWISEDVLMAVLRYAKGIKLYHDNSDWRPVGYMNVQDHLMSLLYIEALRTGRFDRNLIMEVEKDLYRMKKEVAELHGV